MDGRICAEGISDVYVMGTPSGICAPVSRFTMAYSVGVATQTTSLYLAAITALRLMGTSLTVPQPCASTMTRAMLLRFSTQRPTNESSPCGAALMRSASSSTTCTAPFNGANEVEARAGSDKNVSVDSQSTATSPMEPSASTRSTGRPAREMRALRCRCHGAGDPGAVDASVYQSTCPSFVATYTLRWYTSMKRAARLSSAGDSGAAPDACSGRMLCTSHCSVYRGGEDAGGIAKYDCPPHVSWRPERGDGASTSQRYYIVLHIYSVLATGWSTRRRASRSESTTADASHAAMGTAVAGMNPRYTCSNVTCSGMGRSAGASRCGAAQPKAASAARSRADVGFRVSAGIRMPEARVRMRASRSGHGCAGSSGTPSCSGSTLAAPVASASAGL